MRVANIVLNEVPKNSGVTRVANIVLNEALNSNGVTCVGNSVRLIAMGEQ